MPDAPAPTGVQSPPAEVRFREELELLARFDVGDRPPGWRLTPQAVVTFVVGSGGEALKLSKGAKAEKSAPRSLVISEKFVGDRGLVERAVVTLAGGVWSAPSTLSFLGSWLPSRSSSELR